MALTRGAGQKMEPATALSAPVVLAKDNSSSQSLHEHRLDHNPSKLPAFRFGDLRKKIHLGRSVPSLLSPDPIQTQSELAHSTSPATIQGTTSLRHDQPLDTTATTSVESTSPRKPTSSSPEREAISKEPSISNHPSTPSFTSASSQPAAAVSGIQTLDKRPKRAPASHSSNGIETFTGPPPAFTTQRSFTFDSTRLPVSPTTEWALAQQEIYQSIEAVTLPAPVPRISDQTSTANTQIRRVELKSLDAKPSSRPRIPPIRAFRSSATRATLEMANNGHLRFDMTAYDEEGDRDRTLRTLEGFSDEDQTETIRSHRDTERRPKHEPSTDDLFLNLARDDLAQANGGDSNGAKRRSRIALASHRQSLPPNSSTFQMSRTEMPRRGSDLQASPPSTEAASDRFSYRRDRPNVTTPSHLTTSQTRSRHSSATSQSNPNSPRTLTGRDASSQLPSSYGGRRPSIPDDNAITPQRLPGYRQSNLSYGNSRVYNSSPLVSRSMDPEDVPETTRVPADTESTTSTTAPSTVWDELDDLKSRIRKLELTGKLPATSGAAVSHATGDRPPTATTTDTTLSTSPKRGRGLSISPIDSITTGPNPSDIHPLLQSALAKSKPLLNSEIFKALEAAAADALAIASMVGTSGQSGLISSSQSTIGGAVGGTERQLRRKADSMCRSLTELCLALSEDQPAPPTQAQTMALVRPLNGDKDAADFQRSSDGLSRARSTPRAVSRQEARRTTLIGNSALPSPRYVSTSFNNSPKGDNSPVTPSTQTGFSARRASLLIRNRRPATDAPEEDEGTRFRAPSRAATEIGVGASRIRNSPREYTSREEPPPLPPAAQESNTASRLPARKHFASSSLGNSTGSSGTGNMTNNTPGSSGLRYLDRATPERNSNPLPISTVNVGSGSKLPGSPPGTRTTFEPPRTAFGTSGLGFGLGRTGSLGRQRLTRERSDHGVD